MKRCRSRSVLLLPAILSSCVAPSVQAPAPRQVPVTVAPPPVIPPPAKGVDAVSLGNWTYAIDAHGSAARFGITPQASIFVIQCDRLLRAVSLLVARPGAVVGGGVMLRASTTAKSFPAEGGGPFAVVRVPARDPILDALAFSRGRFGVAIDGIERVLPAWPEFTRVVEDCRS